MVFVKYIGMFCELCLRVCLFVLFAFGVVFVFLLGGVFMLCVSLMLSCFFV